MKKVRIGIVGVGGMGASHCKASQEISECKLTAVSDINQEVAEEVGKEFQAKAFTDYNAMFKSGLVDAVLIATPHYFHSVAAVSATKEGLHVLSEKPLSVSVSEADKMVASAKKHKRIFSVMYQRRAEVATRAALKLIREGKLGTISRTLCIDAWYRSQAYYNSGTWRATWKGEGGGVLINQAPHTIDLFLLLGGMPSRIKAKTRTRLHDIEVEDEACALLEYPNGAWGYYFTSTNELPTGYRLEFAGERGKLVLTPKEVVFYKTPMEISKASATAKNMWEDLPTKEVKVKLAKTPKTSTHTRLLKNFCRAILYGEELLSPGEDGVKSVEFINAMIYSGQKKEAVDLPLNRKAYDTLLSNLQKKSKPKKHIVETRETDPKIKRALKKK
ncbi:MAG: Gfo/Idh/MocA family oxidoreductase [Candidatus Ratteibacteria bacterium]